MSFTGDWRKAGEDRRKKRQENEMRVSKNLFDKNCLSFQLSPIVTIYCTYKTYVINFSMINVQICSIHKIISFNHELAARRPGYKEQYINESWKRCTKLAGE